MSLGIAGGFLIELKIDRVLDSNSAMRDVGGGGKIYNLVDVGSYTSWALCLRISADHPQLPMNTNTIYVDL